MCVSKEAWQECKNGKNGLGGLDPRLDDGFYPAKQAANWRKMLCFKGISCAKSEAYCSVLQHIWAEFANIISTRNDLSAYNKTAWSYLVALDLSPEGSNAGG